MPFEAPSETSPLIGRLPTSPPELERYRNNKPQRTRSLDIPYNKQKRNELMFQWQDLS